MKKTIFITFLLLNCFSLFAEFYCSDGPVTIRKLPTVWSDILGTVESFETANVLEVGKEYKFGNTTGNWYKINFENIEGYIYGGYGKMLPEKILVKSYEDFTKIFPDDWEVTPKSRNLFEYKIYKEPEPIIAENSENQLNQVPQRQEPVLVDVRTMMRLDYEIKPKNGHTILMNIFCNPVNSSNGKSLAPKYNLTVSDGNPNFGTKNEYSIHQTSNSVKLETENNTDFKYFAKDWISDYRYDILSFYTDHYNNSDIDGVMINFYSLWKNRKVFDLSKIDTKFIKECNEKHTKDSLYYQLILELFRRCEFQ